MTPDEKNAWSTDPRVFNTLNKEFNFVLDACASELNHKVAAYFTQEMDALLQDWSLIAKGRNVWCNPPYGRGMIGPFMQKAISESLKGVTTVLLVPNTTEANWLPINVVAEIWHIVRGRLSFYHPLTHKPIAGNTKGSMIIIIRPNRLDMPRKTRYIDRNALLNGSIQDV